MISLFPNFSTGWIKSLLKPQQFFNRNLQNDPKIHMEIRGNLERQNNFKKRNKVKNLYYLISKLIVKLLQSRQWGNCYGNRQINGTELPSRNKLLYWWSTNFQQRFQRNSMGIYSTNDAGAIEIIYIKELI